MFQIMLCTKFSRTVYDNLREKCRLGCHSDSIDLSFCSDAEPNLGYKCVQYQW